MSEQAGRELDALVAERVMGWESITDELEIAKREGVPEDVDSKRWHRKQVWFKGNERMACEECGTLPGYSTSIAAAWEVVNHLLCHGWDEKHFFQLHYDNVDLWDASFYKESSSDGGGPEGWGTADSPALAICLAALKAVRN